MYPDLFKGLGLKKENLSKYNAPLVRFDGQVVIPEGQISLPVNMEGKQVTMAFIVVASFSPYTVILGRPWIHAMGAVPSTLHVKVKFRTEQGIAVVKGSQQPARQCLVATVTWKHKQAKQKETQGGNGASCAEELIRVKILLDVDRYFQVGASIKNEDKVETLLFLMQNVNVFTWSSYDVPCVDPKFIVHKLNIDLSFPPKKQKLRRSAKEHIEAVRQEVGRLKEAGAIKEIFFPE